MCSTFSIFFFFFLSEVFSFVKIFKNTLQTCTNVYIWIYVHFQICLHVEIGDFFKYYTKNLIFFYFFVFFNFYFLFLSSIQCLSMHIHLYLHTYIHTHTHIYIYYIDTSTMLNKYKDIHV